MRSPTLCTSASALMLAAMVSVPSSAHHDDGKGEINVPPLELQAHEFNNVVAASAHADSNAPRSFAPCIQGMAADTYPCDGVDMLSHLTLGDLGLSFANDIWGWTDPLTRKDYALLGGTEGTVIVDISDPRRPVIIGTLPTRTSTHRFWRDIKVYADHAFVVSEDTLHGMQVLDLKEVRGYAGVPVTFSATAVYDGFSNAHNLAINEDTGFAYAVGTNTCSGGLHMIDIADPVNPQFAGCFSEHGYIHDTQCVLYRGPDAAWFGREICFNSVADGPSIGNIDNSVSIVDVTDKANPVALGQTGYAMDGYSHQGWLTPDQAYFLHNDELDEVLEGLNTTTRIFDVRDLTDPVLVAAVEHSTTAIGHNAYTRGRFLFASNYTAGLQVFDITRVADGELPEVAYFDLYPENDNPTFEGGTWSNYPYFRQRQIVAVSSMDRGLFVLQPRIGQ